MYESSCHSPSHLSLALYTFEQSSASACSVCNVSYVYTYYVTMMSPLTHTLFLFSNNKEQTLAAKLSKRQDLKSRKEEKPMSHTHT